MATEQQLSENEPSWSARLPRMSPARAFATVFFGVFLLIFLGSALITFQMPQTYSAQARVNAAAPADLERLNSSELLNTVSGRLNLAQELAAEYRDPKPWDKKEVEEMLRRSTRIRRVSGSGLVEIRVERRSPQASALWANTIAEQAQQMSGTIQMVDRAFPPRQPSRPNKVLNLALGALVGIFLGTMAGGVGAKLAVGFKPHDSIAPP